MGGLPCAKNIIDNGKEMRAFVSRIMSAVDKSLGCMETSIQLYSAYATPTEEQEEKFIATNRIVCKSVKDTLDQVAKLAAEIEEDVRKRSGVKEEYREHRDHSGTETKEK